MGIAVTLTAGGASQGVAGSEWECCMGVAEEHTRGVRAAEAERRAPPEWMTL